MNDKFFIQDMQNLKRIGTVDMVKGLSRLKMLTLKPLKEYAPSFITASIPVVSASVSAFSCNKMPRLVAL